MALVRCRSTRHFRDDGMMTVVLSGAVGHENVHLFHPRNARGSIGKSNGLFHRPPPCWGWPVRPDGAWGRRGCAAGGPDPKRGERAVEERGAMGTALPWGQAAKNSRAT